MDDIMLVFGTPYKKRTSIDDIRIREKLMDLLISFAKYR